MILSTKAERTERTASLADPIVTTGPEFDACYH
jgi:hypothetical protein